MPGHDRRVAAGEHRDARFARELARGHLVSQQIEQLGPRPDEDDARPGAGPGELGVLRQEAVAGMDRVDVLGLGQLDDRLDVQIAADRLAGLADLVGLVGLRAVGGEPVFVGIDRHGPDAQLVRRAEDADRDLAAIGGHQLAERGHGRRLSVRGRDQVRSRTGWLTISRRRLPRLRSGFPACRSDRWWPGRSRRAQRMCPRPSRRPTACRWRSRRRAEA